MPVLQGIPWEMNKVDRSVAPKETPPFRLPTEKEFVDGLQPGSLYLVATPIGNLGDISLRALQVLTLADVVAAEDTRRTGQLLAAYGLKKPMISCFAHNEARQGQRILELIREGKTVAVVSDAGMPGINDPGARLVKLAIEVGAGITVVPGATAGLVALAGSGLDTGAFAYCGFFPRRGVDRTSWLERFGDFAGTLVFFESPKRLVATLLGIQEAWGNRNCCVAKELTKRHETYIRGSLEEVLLALGDMGDIKGEITVVMEGYRGRPGGTRPADEVAEMGKVLLAAGLGKKEASRRLAKWTGMSAKYCYGVLIEISG